MSNAWGNWKPGKTGREVVSDKPFESGIKGTDDVAYYGGYLVAESVAPCNIPVITAAPKMYEALKSAVTRLEDFRSDIAHAGYAMGLYDKAISDAREALAIADGVDFPKEEKKGGNNGRTIT